MKVRRRNHENVELSMAPMIDMVFLLLVFFLVSAKPKKEEADLSFKLPGTVAAEEAVEIPDEQRIEIKADGQIVLNEQPLDTPSSKEMPALTLTLQRFKESCKANKTEALVTLVPDDLVPHQRIADVMNVCAIVELDGVTFAGIDEEEE
jgi:biopolymer transport protein ExbD